MPLYLALFAQGSYVCQSQINVDICPPARAALWVAPVPILLDTGVQQRQWYQMQARTCSLDSSRCVHYSFLDRATAFNHFLTSRCIPSLRASSTSLPPGRPKNPTITAWLGITRCNRSSTIGGFREAIIRLNPPQGSFSLSDPGALGFFGLFPSGINQAITPVILQPLYFVELYGNQIFR